MHKYVCYLRVYYIMYNKPIFKKLQNLYSYITHKHMSVNSNNVLFTSLNNKSKIFNLSISHHQIYSGAYGNTVLQAPNGVRADQLQGALRDAAHLFRCSSRSPAIRFCCFPPFRHTKKTNGRCDREKDGV